jgi:hypothetical protein
MIIFYIYIYKKNIPCTGEAKGGEEEISRRQERGAKSI